MRQDRAVIKLFCCCSLDTHIPSLIVSCKREREREREREAEKETRKECAISFDDLALWQLVDCSTYFAVCLRCYVSHIDACKIDSHK